MIPLITHTPRLTLIAASRALLTAELQKPRYFPILLGAAMPTDWPPSGYDTATQQYFLEQLTAGGRTAAGWYGWYVLLKATDTAPTTLVGVGGFAGPPATDGSVIISYSIAADWRGQGLATELVAGLLQQAAQTGQVRRITAYTLPDNEASQKVLLRNGFEPAEPADDGQLGFTLAVTPAVPTDENGRPLW